MSWVLKDEWERAQAGRSPERAFQAKDEQEPSSRCWKKLTGAANKEPFIIWASFPSCRSLLKTFTDFSLFKTYNPNLHFESRPSGIQLKSLLPNTNLALAALLSPVCPFHGATLLPTGSCWHRHMGDCPQDPSGYRSSSIPGEATHLPNFHKPPLAMDI